MTDYVHMGSVSQGETLRMEKHIEQTPTSKSGKIQYSVLL